jgi:hypothetical protein
MMARRLLIVGLMIPLLVSGGGALADTEAEQLRAQLRATVLQLRQLQDQQAAAPQPAATPPPADAAMKARLAAAQAQLRAARQDAAKASQLQATLDKLQAENTALTTAATANAAELEKFKAAYAQAADAGRALAIERDHFRADLTTMTTIATACQAKNTRLAAFARSLLADRRPIGFFQAMVDADPVLGLGRVGRENRAQDHEDTVRADTCDPRIDAAPVKGGG